MQSPTLKYITLFHNINSDCLQKRETKEKKNIEQEKFSFSTEGKIFQS